MRVLSARPAALATLAALLALLLASPRLAVSAQPQDGPDAAALEALMDNKGGGPQSSATHPAYALAFSGSGGMLFWHLGVAQVCVCVCVCV
jgi:hypothetical protein